ncbi:MAG: YebC/PmpR family DNA-binding transcriptional regulator [Fibrobacterota bacterium]
MSGHSKWATIRRKKGATDAARGKVFTKCIREITVAAKNGGGDPEANPSLRLAIDKAKSVNMPNDNIKRAIQKGTGEGGADNYEEVFYEGYGPAGVAFLVKTLTDNRNRTVGEVRAALTKMGGSMAEPGAVNWQFDTKGVILVPKENVSEDKLLEIVLEAGAEDLDSEGEEYEIRSSQDAFTDVRDAIEKNGIEFLSAEITQIAQNMIEVEGEKAESIIKLIDRIDDLDDVQSVYTNADIDFSAIENGE